MDPEKNKNCPSRILYPEKIFFKNEGRKKKLESDK